MGWLESLANGKEYELIVLEIIRKEYPTETWELNSDNKGVDIISSTGKTIEVKSDRQAAITGNFFIEVECNGKPSGIYAYDNIDVLAYAIPDDKLYLFNVAALSHAISTGNFRRVRGGDGYRSQGILIPINKGEEISSKTITLGQSQLKKNNSDSSSQQD